MKKILIFTLLTGLYFTSFSDPVPLTLSNYSLKSIYLEIPGIMNPNLSPMSNSDADLPLGQEIYFFKKNRKYLLFKVDKSLSGQKIKVNKLKKARWKEIKDSGN